MAYTTSCDWSLPTPPISTRYPLDIHYKYIYHKPLRSPWISQTNVSAMFDNNTILLFWLQNKQTFHMFSLRDLCFCMISTYHVREGSRAFLSYLSYLNRTSARGHHLTTTTRMHYAFLVVVVKWCKCPITVPGKEGGREGGREGQQREVKRKIKDKTKTKKKEIIKDQERNKTKSETRTDRRRRLCIYFSLIIKYWLLLQILCHQ